MYYYDLKFTGEERLKYIFFLDLTLTGSILDGGIYAQAYHKHFLLQADSCHLLTCEDDLLEHNEIDTLWESFTAEAANMKERHLNEGYIEANFDRKL